MVNETRDTYAYTGDDPLNEVDPSGLRPISFCASISSCGAGETTTSTCLNSSAQMGPYTQASPSSSTNVFEMGIIGPPISWKWAQSKFSPYFSNDEDTLALVRAKSVQSIVGQLEEGAIEPSELPVDLYVQGGTTYIMNTRTASALTEAGIPREDWQINDMTGNSEYEQRLNQMFSNNNTPTGGFVDAPSESSGSTISVSATDGGEGGDSGGFWDDVGNALDDWWNDGGAAGAAEDGS